MCVCVCVVRSGTCSNYSIKSSISKLHVSNTCGFKLGDHYRVLPKRQLRILEHMINIVIIVATISVANSTSYKLNCSGSPENAVALSSYTTN